MKCSPTMYRLTTRHVSTSSLRLCMGHNLLVTSPRRTAAHRPSRCILISNTRNIPTPIIRHPVTMMAITRMLPGSRYKATDPDEELVFFRRIASLPMPTSMSRAWPIILAAQEQQGKSWTFSVGEPNLVLVMIGRLYRSYTFKILFYHSPREVEYPGGVLHFCSSSVRTG